MTYFVRCTAGHIHYGPHGAAGLLLVHAGRVLLQRRSQHVHHPGTWSIPGGALESGETPEAAALREAREEAGALPPMLRIVDDLAHNCGGWRYTTVVAASEAAWQPSGGWETAAWSWQPLADVERLPLHPGFAASWPQVRPITAEARHWC